MRFKNINVVSLIEMFFSSDDFDKKFSYKLLENEHSKEMICFFTEENKDTLELRVQVEDNEYLNVLLIKHIDSQPYEMCFLNYLTSIHELMSTIGYVNNLYINLK